MKPKKKDENYDLPYKHYSLYFPGIDDDKILQITLVTRLSDGEIVHIYVDELITETQKRKRRDFFRPSELLDELIESMKKRFSDEC